MLTWRARGSHISHPKEVKSMFLVQLPERRACPSVRSRIGHYEADDFIAQRFSRCRQT